MLFELGLDLAFDLAEKASHGCVEEGNLFYDGFAKNKIADVDVEVR